MELGIESSTDIVLSDERFRRVSQLMGSTPSRVASPKVVRPTEVAELSRILSEANEQRYKVVPVGSGSKLDRGNTPSSCDLLLDMSGISGIVEHAAGDMTVTARTGTLLADLQAKVKKANQRLAIDPPFSGTIGGLIATGDSGPLRLRYGGVRDLLLGVTFVLADGTIARGGGKVVKNVAGYDMPKLMTSALGTLGVLTEATFRLHPLSETSATVVLRDMSLVKVRHALNLWLDSGLTPSAADYQLSTRRLLVRWEGSEQSMQGQTEKARTLAASSVKQADIAEHEEEHDLWSKLDAIAQTSENDVLARLICTSSDLPRLLAKAQEIAGDKISLEARAHIGHGHALLRAGEAPADDVIAWLRLLRHEAEHSGGNLVLWRAPLEIRSAVEVWGDPGEGIELMRSLKAQFDPNSTLNPGRFVGGI